MDYHDAVMVKRNSAGMAVVGVAVMMGMATTIAAFFVTMCFWITKTVVSL